MNADIFLVFLYFKRENLKYNPNNIIFFRTFNASCFNKLKKGLYEHFKADFLDTEILNS